MEQHSLFYNKLNLNLPSSDEFPETQPYKQLLDYLNEWADELIHNEKWVDYTALPTNFQSKRYQSWKHSEDRIVKPCQIPGPEYGLFGNVIKVIPVFKAFLVSILYTKLLMEYDTPKNSDAIFGRDSFSIGNLLKAYSANHNVFSTKNFMTYFTLTAILTGKVPRRVHLYADRLRRAGQVLSKKNIDQIINSNIAAGYYLNRCVLEWPIRVP